MSNEKKNSILEFIEKTYPNEIETDYDKGWAYACDEIEKLLDEDDAEYKIAKFIENEINNFFDCEDDESSQLVEVNWGDYSCGSYELCQDVEELLNKEEGSIMIKHMKAPKECDKCLFCREKSNNDYGSFGHCLLLNDKPVNLLLHNKLNDCPIVEVEYSDD